MSSVKDLSHRANRLLCSLGIKLYLLIKINFHCKFIYTSPFFIINTTPMMLRNFTGWGEHKSSPSINTNCEAFTEQMKESFKSLNETFNLPYSDIIYNDDFKDYVEKTVNPSFIKKSSSIKSTPQILEIKNNKETYYKRLLSNSNCNINNYIENMINIMLSEQQEYLDSLPKTEYQRIRDEFEKLLKRLNKELTSNTNKIEHKSLELKIPPSTKPKKSKEQKIKDQINAQKTMICNNIKEYSEYKEQYSSWVF